MKFAMFAVLVLLLTLAEAARGQAQDSVVDLSGDWRFVLDRTDSGIADSLFNKTLPDKIKLPGILQAQGYGDEISITTPWVVGLGNRGWQSNPLFTPYEKPGALKIPFLAQPPRHYLGVAWYQRDIDIPGAWRGKAVHLLLERPRWESRVWVDDKLIGSNNSLVAPHEFVLGLLPVGSHRLTVRLDNRMSIVPGYRPDGHSVSDALGATWNGIAGRIELSATSPVYMDDVQVFPNVEKKAAVVRVHIANTSGQSGTATVTCGSANKVVHWTAEEGADVDLDVMLNAAAMEWDEFHPALQHLTVSLQSADQSTDDKRDVTFGLRQISAKDKTLLLNGHEINLRMTHFGGDFPLTGYPATDVESWKKIIQTCKDYGLNGFRFHSWCPPDAAFAAADELGFYIQPECGMWNPFNPGSEISKMLEVETARIMRAYGNHPSFILLSPSNEPAGRWQGVLQPWTVTWYERDPRRLYAENTGRADLRAEGPQYGISPLRGNRGWFGKDYAQQLQGVHVPVLSHEVGQWCAYPDFDVIKKFTGYLQPGNYELFRDSAAAHGVLDMNKDFAWASGRFQVACYKEECEANLRTPGLSGYQLLDLHDYLGQGTALVGVTDAFWEPKSYVTAAEFHSFSGPVVPLARFGGYVFRTSDALAVNIEVANYGAGPLSAVAPSWRIVDATGKTVVQGAWPERDLAIGKNISLGQVNADLSKLAALAQYKLVVSIPSAEAGATPVGENDWTFWLYPAEVGTGAPADVLVTHVWNEALARLEAGGKVLFTPAASDLDDLDPPLNNVPVFWNRQMNPKLEAMLGLWCNVKHPALAEFPTNASCDWQWIDIVRGMRTVNVEAAEKAAGVKLEPIVSAIDDWNRNYKLAVVMECKVGTGAAAGKLVVCAPDVETNLERRTVARQLRRSLLDYMGTATFDPKVTLTASQAGMLWASGRGQRVITAPTTRGGGAQPGDINEGENMAPKVR